MSKKKKMELQLSRPANVALLYYYDMGLTSEMRKVFGIGFTDIVYYFKDGAMAEYRPAIDNDLIGRVFIKMLKNGFEKVEKVLSKFISHYDRMEELLKESKRINQMRRSQIDKLITEFGDNYRQVWPGVIFAFWTPLWVDRRKLNKLEKSNLEKIIAIRHAHELEYVNAQLFYDNVIDYINNKLKISDTMLDLATPAELIKLIKDFDTSLLLTKLAQRKNGCLIFNRLLLPARNIEQAQKILSKKNIILEGFAKRLNKESVSGQSAYNGKKKGKIKLLFSKYDARKVELGDIIVSPMTTPYFIDAIKKSGAIVTDEGGVVCHAAIVAREMKKPCVIGTKNATLVFKDGDRVEVDADKGVIRKI